VIVIDSSAVVAVFKKEPESGAIFERLSTATEVFISAANLVETSIVLDGMKIADPGRTGLDEFIRRAKIAVEPVSIEHAQLARAAARKYGKGTGHPAQLNFGDCFAYALAKAMDVPLLYKGNDFSQTDIVAAL
jgi:ribonuclease VapC